MPRWWPISTAAAPISVLSRLPSDMVVWRMSRMPGPQQASTGAPGAAVWIAVMVPSTSAQSSASVPAGVTGAVAPEIGIE